MGSERAGIIYLKKALRSDPVERMGKKTGRLGGNSKIDSSMVLFYILLIFA